jgi:hypothetical protein
LNGPTSSVSATAVVAHGLAGSAGNPSNSRRRLIEKDYLTALLNGASLRNIASRERSRRVSMLIEIKERRSFWRFRVYANAPQWRAAFVVSLV